MIGASFDRSKTLPLYARIAETANPATLIFLDEAGDPVNLTGKVFTLVVKRRSFSTDAVFTLTMGSGLAITGTSSNQLQIDIDADQSDVVPATYFYTLKETTEDQTWLNGTLVFHNGQFDGINEDFEIVNNMDIRITLSNGSTSGLLRIQGNWDASSNLFPSTNVLKGYWWKISVPGVLGGYAVPVGAKIMSLSDTPGQTLSNWDITE